MWGGVVAYLPVRVEGCEGGVQHAAPHISVSVVQRVGDEEEEERRDLGFVQVLGQLVQRQGDATPEERGLGELGALVNDMLTVKRFDILNLAACV